MPKITSNFFVGSLGIFLFAFKFNPKWIATKTKGKLFFIVSYTAELNSSKLTSSWLISRFGVFFEMLSLQRTSKQTEIKH